MCETVKAQTEQELYELLINNPKLCGSFKMENQTIIWDLYKDIRIEIGFDILDAYLGLAIKKKLFGRFEYTQPITHWHSPKEEIYGKICSVGAEDCVLVLRKSIFGYGVLYWGNKDRCKYKPEQRWNFGRLYFCIPSTELKRK